MLVLANCAVRCVCAAALFYSLRCMGAMILVIDSHRYAHLNIDVVLPFALKENVLQWSLHSSDHAANLSKHFLTFCIQKVRNNLKT